MFLKQALHYNNPFWMYLLGSFVIIIFNVLGQLPLTYAIMQEGVVSPGGDPMEMMRNIDKNLQLFLLLIPFAIGFLGLWLVVRKLHERSLISITTSREKVDWNRTLFAFLIWSGVTVLLVAVDYTISPDSYEWNFNLKRFAVLFVIGVLLIPIQTSLEEYIFRVIIPKKSPVPI